MPKLTQYFILIALFFLSIITSFLICKTLIRVQKRKHVAQPVHALGVKTHFKKSGTPLFGGVSFFLAPLLIFLPLCFFNMQGERNLGFLFGISSFFFIGLSDDLIKGLKKNEKGLRASVRIMLEIISSCLCLIMMGFDESFTWTINFYPFNKEVFIGILYLFLCIFMIIGSANSANLMDGLDGLSSGVTLIGLAAIMCLSFIDRENFLGTYLLLLCGGIIGFLILNSHPAKIFMGDCGSLFLGATLALSTIYLDKILLLPLVGFLYIVETLSVIIQVIYFKFTHKRVFLMAPIHHHFELKHVPEYRITLSYYLCQSAIVIVILLMEVLI
ncbi:MAG TPA: phospho-N-acetylmuramoyl-pentapeptide-transferase [Firmicutes bacterium]|nr:phospho-N-acetylmuramoyl-pentapeptide-transferase [Bacillota bacterium]